RLDGHRGVADRRSVQRVAPVPAVYRRDGARRGADRHLQLRAGAGRGEYRGPTVRRGNRAVAGHRAGGRVAGLSHYGAPGYRLRRGRRPALPSLQAVARAEWDAGTMDDAWGT